MYQQMEKSWRSEQIPRNQLSVETDQLLIESLIEWRKQTTKTKRIIIIFQQIMAENHVTLFITH